MNLATSLAIIIIFGMIFNALFVKIKIPGLLGMLLVGILFGPYCLDWISDDLLKISKDLRTIALIIILLRAGLGISRQELQKIGKTAIKLSFIPVVFEGIAIMCLSVILLKFSWVEGGMLGFILAPVSPAVIVPSMLRFTELGIGEKKGIPILILTAASIDGVVAITLFSAFFGAYTNQNLNIGRQIIGIPVSIILGVLLGFITGLALIVVFKKIKIRDSKKILIMLGISILLTALEQILVNKIKIASLLGVMTVGFVLFENNKELAKRLSAKLNKIWLFAEILLFVLVGAEVNIGIAWKAGIAGIILICGGLIARSIGVIVSTIGTKYTLKEKVFCIISYLPKATIQAVIGSIPMSKGIKSGEVIFAMAILAILITAPLGSMGIDLIAKKDLE